MCGNSLRIKKFRVAEAKIVGKPEVVDDLHRSVKTTICVLMSSYGKTATLILRKLFLLLQMSYGPDHISDDELEYEWVLKPAPQFVTHNRLKFIKAMNA